MVSAMNIPQVQILDETEKTGCLKTWLNLNIGQQVSSSLWLALSGGQFLRFWQCFPAMFQVVPRFPLID